MNRWRAIGGVRNRSKLWGPAGVVLALVVGATLPIALSAAAPASSLASQPAVATCSPSSSGPPVPVVTAGPNATVVPTSAPVTTTTTIGQPPPCTPTLTAVPSAELADGQTITLTGTGFTPNTGIGWAECEAGTGGESDCDLSTVGETESDGIGAFSIDYSVTRILDVNNASIDCALTPCIIGAADISDYSIDADAAIGFNPNIPPELQGTVTPTGKVNTTTGVAVITGKVICTEPTEVEVDVDLSQVYHRRWNFTNDGYTEVNCTATKKGNTWKVSVPPGLGLFGVGKATAEVDLEGEIGDSYRDVTFTGPVTLAAKK